MANTSFSLFNGSDVIKYNSTEFTLPAWTILTVTTCIVGFLANSLIIIVILCGSLTHFVIMNLLLALATIENLYLLVVIEKQKGIFGTILIGPSLLHCRISVFFLYATSIASSWITVFIAVERFIAIFYPFRVHIICSRRVSYVTILAIVILALVIPIPFFYGCSVYSADGIYDCHGIGQNAQYDLLVIPTVYLCYTVVPFSIITTLNLLIMKRIRSQRAFRIKSRSHTSSLAARDTSLLSIMTAISTVFVITCFPGICFMLYTYSQRYLHGSDYHFGDWVARFLLLLEDINHCVNFFLYCITGSIFRNSLFQMFKCKKKHYRNSYSHEMVTISQNVM